MIDRTRRVGPRAFAGAGAARRGHSGLPVGGPVTAQVKAYRATTEKDPSIGITTLWRIQCWVTFGGGW